MRCLTGETTISLQAVPESLAALQMYIGRGLYYRRNIGIATQCQYVELGPVSGMTEHIYVDPAGPTSIFTYPTSEFVGTSTTPSGNINGYTRFGTGTYRWNAPYDIPAVPFGRGPTHAVVGQTLAVSRLPEEGVWYNDFFRPDTWGPEHVGYQYNCVINMSNVTLAEAEDFFSRGYTSGYWAVPGSGQWATKWAWHGYSHYAILKMYSREHYLEEAIAADAVCVSEDPGYGYWYGEPDAYVYDIGYFTVPPTASEIEDVGVDFTLVTTIGSAVYTHHNYPSVFQSNGGSSDDNNRIVYLQRGEITASMADYFSINNGDVSIEVSIEEEEEISKVYYKTGQNVVRYEVKMHRETKSPAAAEVWYGYHPIRLNYYYDKSSTGFDEYIGQTYLESDGDVDSGRYLLAMVPESLGLYIPEGSALKVPSDQVPLCTDFGNPDFNTNVRWGATGTDQYGISITDQMPEILNGTYFRLTERAYGIRLILAELPNRTIEDMSYRANSLYNYSHPLWSLTYKEYVDASAKDYFDNAITYSIDIETANAVGAVAPAGGLTILGVVIVDEYGSTLDFKAEIKYGYNETYFSVPSDDPGIGSVGGYYSFANLLDYSKTRIDYWNWEVVTP